jgi:putative spermidine/putrescine transport system permease protein
VGGIHTRPPEQPPTPTLPHKGGGRILSTPYLLSAPALALYAVFLLIPLGSIALLSVASFGFYTGIRPGFGLHNYAEVLGDGYFHAIFARTFGIALGTTALAALIGTPEAYILHRMRNPWKGLFLLLALGPLLISVVVRTLGWAMLFGSTGVINQALVALRLVREPVDLMYSLTGVVIALTHVLVPFMVIAVWAALQRLDPRAEAAARSLGASAATVFRRIVLPQAVPGILSGSVIVFALAASAFATPAIIGGRRLKVVATTAYDEFLNTLNWPLGAAIAVLLLLANVAILVGYNRLVERRFARVLR